ncbi:MAG: hypothetical protein FWE80_04340 [Oscillospiraceae bacterium]|nr:hypothetical protein [Oscillospiraceae bacterium]
MDRRAKAITDAARQEKLQAEAEINARAEEIRAEYLERARRRIVFNNQTERELAEEQWRKRAGLYAEQEKNLESKYTENADLWVETVVKRALE